jgi:hypothetical protein
MERDAEGNCVYHYVWPKETANAYRKGGIIYDLGFEWDEEGPYTDGGKRVTPCSYEQAALIEGLDRCHADWFAERRERIYALKERVLRRLVKSARERDASRIWGDCLSILSDILSRTEAEYLLAMDRFYEGLMAEGQPAFPSLTRCRIYANAGLSDLLLVIAHFEKEINIGTMANTAAIMESLPPKVKPLPISYYKSFGREWRPVLDKAIKRFIGLERRERRFWSDYPSRAIQAMTEAFQDRERANPKGFNESELEKANVSFKNCMPYHSVWLETCLGMATNGLLVHGSNSLAIHATNRNAWARSEAMRPFPTPPDTRWDQVTIQFLNREDVRITLGSASARRNFAEMGFRDARKQGVQPNQLWDLLRIFAKHDGRIEWRNPLRELRGNRSKIKMRVHELRGRLRACFPGIADKDPFKPYRRVRAYETKFTLHSKEPHDTIRILK